MIPPFARSPVRRRLLAWGLGGLVLAPAAYGAPPVITLDIKSVAVSGITPGAAAGLVGVAHGFNGFAGYQHVWSDLLVDGDADGTVDRDLEVDLPINSVWAAVDAMSGEISLAVPEGAELIEVPVPENAFAVPGQVTDQRRYIHVLLVRPGSGSGAGAWAASFGDGGVSDADGEENLAISAPLVSLSAIVTGAASSTAPPENLVPGDVVVVVDLETLEVYTARLAG